MTSVAMGGGYEVPKYTLYESVFEVAVHVKTGLVETPVAPSAGKGPEGASGLTGEMTVMEVDWHCWVNTASVTQTSKEYVPSGEGVAPSISPPALTNIPRGGKPPMVPRLNVYGYPAPPATGPT